MPSGAAVVVLANRTQEEVRFTISPPRESARDHTLVSTDVLAVPVTGGIEIAFSSTGGTRHRCRLRGNEIYCFVGDAKALQLKQVGFTGTWRQPEKPLVEDETPKVDRPAAKTASVLVKVPVKIVVDQAEPFVQKIWEKRLRQRLEAASAILEHHCRVQLEVIEVGTWQSDERLKKLSELMRDFRGKVAPGKARLVLGFTGLLGARRKISLWAARRGRCTRISSSANTSRAPSRNVWKCWCMS